MSPDLAIPPAVEEVLAAFDAAGAPLDEHVVKQALSVARKGLTEPSDAESFGAWAEILAFALVGSRHDSNPWNTYFGPMGSGVKDDGTTVYFPDIAEADAQVVAHWAQRAKSVKHPVLKARYADLVWDMSRPIARTKPDVTMARIAIDAYLDSLAQDLQPDIHGKFEAALRGLDLAVMLNDAPRIDTAREALLKLHREAIAAGKGLWWKAFDRLIDDKRVRLSDAERGQLIADLEGIAAKRSVTSDLKMFDPHATESAAERLIKFYRKHGRVDDAKRLHAVVARAFEHFASLGDAMLASSVLQTAVNAYRDAGMREDSQRVRVVIAYSGPI